MISPLRPSLTYQVGKDVLHKDQTALVGKQDKAERKRLEEACAEFESLFMYNVLKQMRKTIFKSGLIDGGKGEEIFTSLMDEELSKQMSMRQGLGLRGVLIEQLTGERIPLRLQGGVSRMYTTQQGSGARKRPFVLPVEGRVSSAFGWRNDPFTGERAFHHGIDIASPPGSVVSAVEGGRVVFSGWRYGYGNTVEIEHANGFTSLYAHNARNLVEAGEQI